MRSTLTKTLYYNWTIAILALACVVIDPFVMPRGSEGLDDTVITCIGVTDLVGSTSYMFIRQVIVRENLMPYTGIQALIGNDFKNVSEMGNPANVASFAVSISSTIDKTYLVKNGSNTSSPIDDKSNDQETKDLYNKGTYVEYLPYVEYLHIRF